MNAAELRKLALSLPEAEEREKWEETAFRVRGNIFLMMSSDGATASVKATRTLDSGIMVSAVVAVRAGPDL